MHGKREKRDRRALGQQGALTLCLVLCLVQFLYAAPQVVDTQAGPKEAVKKAEAKAGSAEKEQEKPEKRAKYVYSPAGKTDPFESFITPGTGISGATIAGGRGSEWPEGKGEILKEGPKTELQTIEISSLTLTSIIKGEGKIWAMVRDSKGRGYFLEKGTKIGTGRGEVDKIECVEKETPFGIESMRKVVIKEPYRNREKNIEYRFIEMEMPYTMK